MILLDTDVCIEILRGNENVIQKRETYDGETALSFMSVAELYYGAEKSLKPLQNIIIVEEFLLSVLVFQTDFDILKTFGLIKARLELSGTALSDADLFIASTAITKCKKLITGKVKHYKKIEELNIENWVR